MVWGLLKSAAEAVTGGAEAVVSGTVSGAVVSSVVSSSDVSSSVVSSCVAGSSSLASSLSTAGSFTSLCPIVSSPTISPVIITAKITNSKNFLFTVFFNLTFFFIFRVLLKSLLDILKCLRWIVNQKAHFGDKIQPTETFFSSK